MSSCCNQKEAYTEGCSILATDQLIGSHPGNMLNADAIYAKDSCSDACLRHGTAFECSNGVLTPVGAACLQADAAAGDTEIVVDDLNGFIPGKSIKLPKDYGSILVAGGPFLAGETITVEVNGVSVVVTLEEDATIAEVTELIKEAADSSMVASAANDADTVHIFSNKESGKGITYSVVTDSAAGTVTAAGATLDPVVVGEVLSVDATTCTITLAAPLAADLSAGLSIITEFCPELIRGLLECDMCSCNGCWPAIATIYSAQVYCSRIKAWGPDLKAALPNIVCVECC